MHNLLLLALTCALCTVGFAQYSDAAEAPAPLKVGDPAPDATAKDETGKDVKLSSFKDKSGLVIFFFPKAFTGG